MNDDRAVPQLHMPLGRETSDRLNPRKKRGGPPNRMNDLSYRDWMKFQKSFFQYSSDQALLLDCVHFFTKSQWADGSPSESLIIGCTAFSPSEVEGARVVRHVRAEGGSMGDVLDALVVAVRDSKQYDFVVVDLRSALRQQEHVDTLVGGYSETLFGALRTVLKDDMYCCVLVANPEPGWGGFPFAWSVGLSARRHLRLRDEKVGICGDSGGIVYCLFMQAKGDGRPRTLMSSETVCVSEGVRERGTPGWIIPKPPPRRPNEILHPGKFPETLIEEFVKMFTQAGDRVLDPMVGTGSTVLAAMRTGRHGVGIDISEGFVGIARQRISDEATPTLFGNGMTEGDVYVGDATRLDDVGGLAGMRFQYAVTSPPYWSMLRNPGNENQKARRDRNLPLVYSDRSDDLGNVADYDRFLDLLEEVYVQVGNRLVDDAVLTVIVKNVKRDHVLYTLAWDLTARMCRRDGYYTYAGATLWLQDDIRLKPFAVGIHWVSNILHTYCLHFRKKESE